MLSIPCSSMQGRDVHVWHPSVNGVYSVKTGYAMATEVLSSSIEYSVRSSWMKLWNCKVPKKVRSFVWRAVRNCIPNRFNLQRRGLQVPSNCVLCDGFIENSWHLLWTILLLKLVGGRLTWCL